ncbi:hypothetical protein SPLC1_S300020 [Arthrospira platensis C1]|nr:hypothetical protein SPLC1_S300020 [Arthrospira platensis C1]
MGYKAPFFKVAEDGILSAILILTRILSKMPDDAQS